MYDVIIISCLHANDIKCNNYSSKWLICVFSIQNTVFFSVEINTTVMCNKLLWFFFFK